MMETNAIIGLDSAYLCAQETGSGNMQISAGLVVELIDRLRAAETERQELRHAQNSLFDRLSDLTASKEAAEKQEPEPYDAGCLNDFGGGNVGWWHDYIRSELGRAHDHYAEQFNDRSTSQQNADKFYGNVTTEQSINLVVPNSDRCPRHENEQVHDIGTQGYEDEVMMIEGEQGGAE